MNFPSSTRPPPSLAFVVTLAAVIHCVSASFHVYTGGMNPDEGFYAIAARAVMHGEVPNFNSEFRCRWRRAACIG